MKKYSKKQVENFNGSLDLISYAIAQRTAKAITKSSKEKGYFTKYEIENEINAVRKK